MQCHLHKVCSSGGDAGLHSWVFMLLQKHQLSSPLEKQVQLPCYLYMVRLPHTGITFTIEFCYSKHCLSHVLHYIKHSTHVLNVRKALGFSPSFILQNALMAMLYVIIRQLIQASSRYKYLSRRWQNDTIETKVQPTFPLRHSNTYLYLEGALYEVFYCLRKWSIV